MCARAIFGKSERWSRTWGAITFRSFAHTRNEDGESNTECSRSSLRWSDLGVRLREHKAESPITRHALAIPLRRSKRPLSGALKSQIGEILARSGGIQLSIRYSPRWIHVHFDADAHPSANRIARFLRNVRQDLIQDLTFS